MNKFLIFFIFFIFCHNNIFAQKSKQFKPIKDSITDNSLQIFIDTLKAIVERKDKKIFTLLHTNITNGFEVNIDGIRYFKKIWVPLSNNELWNTLNKILSYGGQYIKELETKKKNLAAYVYPYFFDEQIDCEADYYELYVIDGNNLYLRDSASMDGKKIKAFNYEVVRMTDSTRNLNKNGWFYVQTLDNLHTGFIQGIQLYNFADYRMIIRKQNGVWKITALISGG